MEDLSITLDEARAQLADKSARVTQIKNKLAELRVIALGVNRAADKNVAALAVAYLDGGEISEEELNASTQGIQQPTMTPTQARTLISGLESVLAGALDEESQAAGALRRASVAELKATLHAECQAFDEQAKELAMQWMRVQVLAGRVAGLGIVSPLPLEWTRLVLPRAVQIKSHNPYQSTGLYATAEALMTGPLANVARNQIDTLLNEKGIGK